MNPHCGFNHNRFCTSDCALFDNTKQTCAVASIVAQLWKLNENISKFYETILGKERVDFNAVIS